MDEVRPDPWRKRAPGDEPAAGPAAEVGEFRQGSPLSQWALARYLVGRALAESMGTALLATAILLAVLAGVVWWLGSTFWGVLLLVLAVAVLVLRAAMLAVLRRLTGAGRFGPIEQRLRALVDDTRGDVLRELRRVGLPGRVWTLPLLAFRFLGRGRRADTVERLRRFEVDRAVPPGRLDELHLLLRAATRGGLPPEP